MSVVDYILVGYAIALTFVGFGGFHVVRTWRAQVANELERLVRAFEEQKPAPDIEEFSEKLLTLHRKSLEHQATLENLELRMTDTRDILEKRYNRLRMRQTRAEQEGEEGEEPVDLELRQELLEALNGAEGEEQQPQPRRGRLVPKHGRDRYGRR